jgi:PAS domain S-box-containing protein
MHLAKEPAGKLAMMRENRSQSERRFQALIDKSSDVIALVNAQGQITYMSSSLNQLTGHLPEAFLGAHVLLLVHADEQSLLGQMLEDVRREQGKARRAECRIHCKDSSYRLCETTLTNFLHDPAIASIVVNLHDISERKQAEQEWEKLFQEFISVAGHELKTPVTSLKGFTQLLYRRFKKRGEDEALRFLSRMDSQLDRLTGLINDLLDISRIQAGKLEYHDAPFDLDVLVRETVEHVQASSQLHRLLLENPAKARVYGDRERIGQVLANLLTNAIKYSPATDRVIVRVETSGNEALVSVQDFGIGIGEDDQQKIFDRFYQVNNKDILPSGLGIGLYLARRVIERHRGRIWVRSQEGEGSTFRFTLPLFEG